MAVETGQHRVKSAVQDLIWVIEHQTKAFLTAVESICQDVDDTDEKIDLQLLTNDVKEAVCQIVCQIQKAISQHVGVHLDGDANVGTTNTVERAEEKINRVLDTLHREVVDIKSEIENDTQLELVSDNIVKPPLEDGNDTDHYEVCSDQADSNDVVSVINDSSAEKISKPKKKKSSFKIKIKKPVKYDGDYSTVKSESNRPSLIKASTVGFKSKRAKLKSTLNNSVKSKSKQPHALETINSVIQKRRYTKVEHSRFRCRICVKAFSSKGALKTHLNTSRHVKKAKASTEAADGETDNADSNYLYSAMDIDEPQKSGKKKYSYPPVPQDCTLCNERVKSKYLLKQHYIKCHPSEAEKHACDHCKKPFSSEEALAEHVKTHEKKRNCQLCMKTFSSTSRYKEHLGTLSHYRKKQEQALKTDGDGTAVDDEEDESLLFPHAMRVCSICGQTFSSKTSLYNHMHAIHSTSNDFICDICGKSWNCRAKLSAHMDTHLKRYKCDYCGESFSRKRLRDSHRRIHTGEQPFKCPHCPKAFREGYLLRKHVKTHSNARPFSCSSCDAKFKIKGHLDRHLSQVHNSERPHKCTYCAEGFIEKRHLQKHLFQHTGQSEFRCTYCKKFLANKNSLNTHLMQYHNQPLPVLPSAEHLLPQNKQEPKQIPVSEALPVKQQTQPQSHLPDYSTVTDARIKEEAEKALKQFQNEIEEELADSNELRRSLIVTDVFQPTDNNEPPTNLFADAQRSLFQPDTTNERNLFLPISENSQNNRIISQSENETDPSIFLRSNSVHTTERDADRTLFPIRTFGDQTETDRTIFQIRGLTGFSQNEVDRSIFPLRGTAGQAVFTPANSDIERVLLPQNEVERAMLQYAYDRHMLQ